MQRIVGVVAIARAIISICFTMETFVAAAHADGYKSSSTSQAISTTSSDPVSSAWENLHPTDAKASRPRLSGRVKETEPAHIEAVLSKYARLDPQPANLAQGVAHWDPPPAALREIARQESSCMNDSGFHKYGPALGLPSLRKALVGKLERENGLDMTGQEVCRQKHEIIRSNTLDRYIYIYISHRLAWLKQYSEPCLQCTRTRITIDCCVSQVMVTAGGNQAFAMVALALLDPGDTALLV